MKITKTHQGAMCYHNDFDPQFRGWQRTKRQSSVTAKNFEKSLASVFQDEVQKFPEIATDPTVLGGTPVIIGTRIPVSMVLDAIQFYGKLAGATKSYPDLTPEQIKQAVSFSAAVLECRVGSQTQSIDRRTDTE